MRELWRQTLDWVQTPGGAFTVIIGALTLVLSILGLLRRYVVIPRQPSGFPLKSGSVSDLQHHLVADTRALTVADNEFIRREPGEVGFHDSPARATRILIRGPGQSGKTREALEFLREAVEVDPTDTQVFWLPGAGIPEVADPGDWPHLRRRIILFIDDLPQVLRMSAQRPRQSGRGGVSVRTPLQRLESWLERFEATDREFTFVATQKTEDRRATDEYRSAGELDAFWRTFTAYRPKPFTPDQEAALVSGIARAYGIRIDDDAGEHIVRVSQGRSPQALVTYLQRWAGTGDPVTRAEAQQFSAHAFGLWETHTYRKLLQACPDVEAVYMAMRVLAIQLHCPAPLKVVAAMAADILPSRPGITLRRTRARRALRRLIEDQHVGEVDGTVAAPDFQLEGLPEVALGSVGDGLKRAASSLPHVALCVEMALALGLDDQAEYSEPYFRRVARLQRRSAPAWVCLGAALQAQGRLRAAERAFRRAVTCADGEVTAHLGLGLALEAQERYAEAEEAFARATELQPENWTAWAAMAESLDHQGKHIEALDAYERGVQAAPLEASAWGMVAHAYQKQEQYEKAEAAMERALAQDPDNLGLLRSLGMIRGSGRDFEGAISALERVREADESDASTIALIGVAQLHLDRPDLAEPRLGQAVALAPDNFEAWSWWLLSLTWQGDWDQAEQLVTELRGRCGWATEDWIELGIGWHEDGALIEAEAAFLTAGNLDPASASAWYLLGLVLGERDQHEAAARAFALAADQELEHVGAWANLGIALILLSRYDEAEKALLHAKALDDSDTATWRALSVCVGEQARYAEAETYAREAIRLDPSWGDPWHDLGVTLAAQERYAEAAQAFQTAADLMPDSALVLYHLACTLALMCDKDALVPLARAVRLDAGFAREARDNEDLCSLHSDEQFWRILNEPAEASDSCDENAIPAGGP